MRITDLAYDQQGNVINPWRADLQPARFIDADFYVDAGSREGGRRTVLHEFPKKNVPYTEDMGKRATEFSVRGYCISYPHDVLGSSLARKDYRIARDYLRLLLDRGEPGPLYLPTFKGHEVVVICPRYRLTEEERFGGYCVFDMTFLELGAAPREPPEDPRTTVINTAAAMRQRIINLISAGPDQTNV